MGGRWASWARAFKLSWILAALGMIGTIFVVAINNVVVNLVDDVVFVVGVIGIVATTPVLFVRWLLRK